MPKWYKHIQASSRRLKKILKLQVSQEKLILLSSNKVEEDYSHVDLIEKEDYKSFHQFKFI